MAKITRKPAKKAAPVAKTAKAKKAPAKSKPVAEKKSAPAEKKSAPAAKRSAPARRNTINHGAKITVLVEGNPKRGGAAERFALYGKAKTVGDYIDAGGKASDIRWDANKGFISLG